MNADIAGRSEPVAEQPLPTSGGLLLLVGVAAVAYWAACRIIWNAPDTSAFLPAHRSQLMLWESLVGVVAATGTVAVVAMGIWLRGVIALFEPAVPVRSVLRWMVFVVIIFGALWRATGFFSVRTFSDTAANYHRHELVLLVLFCMIVALPGLVGFLAVRSLAANQDQWRKGPDDQVAMALRLRSELRRFLATLGGFLTLIVVQLGARRRAVLSLDTGMTFPPEFVLLCGLLFAGLLALMHATATVMLDARCGMLLDRYAPLPSPTASDLAAGLGRRQSFATMLGMGGSWQRTFESGVVVLGPLLTALVGSAIAT